MQDVRDNLSSGSEMPDANTDNLLRGILSTSFNTLSHLAQNIFLDTVSVLHGKRRITALWVWEAWWKGQGSAELALEELQHRALVSIDSKQRLVVHDVIKALGRGIIRDPGSRFYGSRAWVENGQLVKFCEVCCF